MSPPCRGRRLLWAFKDLLNYTIQLLFIRRCMAINQTAMFYSFSAGTMNSRNASRSSCLGRCFQLTWTADGPPERTTPPSLSASKVICFERLRLWILKNTVIRDLLHVWESITNLIYHWKGTKLTDLPIRAAYALNMTRWWYEKLIYVFEKAEGRKASRVLCRTQSRMSWFFKGRFIKA